MFTRFKLRRRPILDYNKIVYDVTPYIGLCWGWLKDKEKSLTLTYNEKLRCYTSNLMLYPFYKFKVPVTKEEAMRDIKAFDKKVKKFVHQVYTDEETANRYIISWPVYEAAS